MPRFYKKHKPVKLCGILTFYRCYDCGDEFYCKAPKESNYINFCDQCKENYNSENKFINCNNAKKIYLLTFDEFDEFKLVHPLCYSSHSDHYIKQEIEEFANIYHPEWFQKQQESIIRKEKRKQGIEERKGQYNQILNDHKAIILKYVFLNDYLIQIRNGRYPSGFINIASFIDYLINVKLKDDLVEEFYLKCSFLITFKDLIYDAISKRSITPKKLKKGLSKIVSRYEEVEEIKLKYDFNLIEDHIELFVTRYIKNGSLKEYSDDNNEHEIIHESIESYIKNIYLRFNEVDKVKSKYDIASISTISKIINPFVIKYVKYGILIEHTSFDTFEYDTIDTYVRNIYLRHKRISNKINKFGCLKSYLQNDKLSNMYIRYGLNFIKNQINLNNLDNLDNLDILDNLDNSDDLIIFIVKRFILNSDNFKFNINQLLNQNINYEKARELALLNYVKNFNFNDDLIQKIVQLNKNASIKKIEVE
jgi:hypothetical protein